MSIQCMYDNSGETDKEVLLQAALLLSFWHSERDSHTEPWYWSGMVNEIAFTVQADST